MEWIDLSFHPEGDRLFVRAVDTDQVEHLIDMGVRSTESIALNKLMARAAGDGKMVTVHSDPCHLDLCIATLCAADNDNGVASMPLTVIRGLARAFTNVETVTLSGTVDPFGHPDLLAILNLFARQSPKLDITLRTGGGWPAGMDLGSIVNHETIAEVVFELDGGLLLNWSGNDGDEPGQIASLQELLACRGEDGSRMTAAIDVSVEDVGALAPLIARLQEFDLDALDCRNHAAGNKREVDREATGAVRLLEEMQRDVRSRFPVRLPQVAIGAGDGFHCRQAFTNFSLGGAGGISPCRAANGTQNDGLFAGPADWNGPLLCGIRDMIAAGQVPLDQCHACPERSDPEQRMEIKSAPELPPISLDQAFAGNARRASHQAMIEERQAHYNAAVLRDERMPLGPRTLALGIANPCNFRCPFCIYHATDLKKAGTHASYPVKYMAVENVKNAVRQFWPERVSLGVTGEAFLHPEIDEILTFLADEGVKASFSSNMAVRGFLDIFSRHGGVFSSINVSLDATTQEEYVRLTPRSQLRDTLEVVRAVDRLLVENQWAAELECNFVVERKPGWVDFIRRGLALVQGLDLKRLGSINFNNCAGLTNEIDHTLTVADRPRIMELLAEIQAGGPYLHEIRLPLVLDMNRSNQCSDPWQLLSVASDMTVSPCCRVVPNEAIGRLDRDGPLLWNNEIMVESRKRIAKGQDAFEICKTCPSRGGERPVIAAHSAID